MEGKKEDKADSYEGSEMDEYLHDVADEMLDDSAREERREDGET